MYRKGNREKRIQGIHGKGIHRIRRKAAVFLAGMLLAGTLGACAGQTGGAPGDAANVSSGEQSGYEQCGQPYGCGRSEGGKPAKVICGFRLCGFEGIGDHALRGAIHGGV